MKKWLVGFVILSMWGCGTTRTQLVEKGMSSLKQELIDVQKSYSALSVTVEDFETRLFLIQDELDTYRKKAARLQMQEPQLPVVRLGPRGDPATVVESKATRRTVVRGDKLTVFEFDQLRDGKLVRRSGARTRAKKTAAVKSAVRPTLPAKAHDAVRLYRQSFEEYKKHRYEAAIAGFQRFVQENPTHGYADNAIYWMGESYYDRGLWRKALQTFQQVIQNYPLENKVPDAMLKLGLCQKQLNNIRQAREILLQVSELYPKSPVARIANSRLKSLK
jgi:tol-pal system protein YbgF